MATSSYTPGEALTLPVSNLSCSTSFYLSALAPLGYGFISKVQHETNTTASEAVGLGPQGTSRVDVFLSQTYYVGAASPTAAHVVFPAISRIAVRDFYTAALQAGGQPVARPDNLAASDGMFASIVTDPDGNQIEVCFADPAPLSKEGSATQSVRSHPAPSEANGPVEHWREDVGGSAATKSVVDSASSNPIKSTSASQAWKSAVSAAGQSQTLKSAVSAAQSNAPAKQPDGASKAASSRNNSQRESSIPTASVKVGSKSVVGTLIGAAAGAALAYSMVRSKQDSQEREEEHKRQLRTNDVKAEARAYRDMADRRQVSGKVDLDRDSGYSSGSHREPPPSLLKYRNVTYPQPSSSDPRGRSTTRRFIDFDPRTSSPDQYYAPPARRQSVGASSRSASTIKPVRRTQSNAGYKTSDRRTESGRRPVSPLHLPAPPSMPAAPATKSRRDSRSSRTSGPSRKSSVKSKPPSSFSRAMGVDTRQSEDSTPSKGTGSYQSSRKAKNIPLPASEIISISTVKPSSSHRSTRTARKVPLPPSEAPTALTAKALSQQDKSHPLETRGKLDELATLVPDDSISCASEREERKERESRTSRRSQKSSSKTSRGSKVPAR